MLGLMIMQTEFFGELFIHFSILNVISFAYPVIRCKGNVILTVEFTTIVMIYLVNTVGLYLVCTYLTRKQLVKASLNIFEVDRV